MSSTTMNKSESTNSLTQPKVIAGEIDEDNVYRNRFYRPGKVLDSNIIIENGGVRNLKKRAKEYVPEKCHESKNYLIVDEIVDEIYGEQVLKGFNDGGVETYKIVVPADAVDESGNPSAERHKTLAVFSGCCDQILANGISKNTCIISLGGGVVNNLCGFLASSLYRGITLIHITTSMMGMTDAAIDFKQAVNHQLGKNLLGSYYPATNIIIDPEVLQTLSKRHILNGISEAMKHALCQSRKMTEDMVGPLSEDLHKALRDPVYLEKVCRDCIDHKVPTLIHYNESDFNEMVPQYGHAVAHAVEHLSFHSKGVSPLLHGEAVAVGMCVTAEVAKILGICDQRVVDEHYKFIGDSGLPVFVPDGLSLDAIQNKLCYDKHYVKKPTMGLLVDIGEVYCQEDGNFAVEVDNHVIRQALEANMNRRNNCLEEPKDLYTIDAVKAQSNPSTFKHGFPSDSTFMTSTSSTSGSSEGDDDSAGEDWDPATATSFGPKSVCVCAPNTVEYCSCC
uniref:3-dehydroquinate synthase domain-containing protein n=1 Tax=Entomoneis paludosa TaxID=265537 RepID=A0A7S2YJ01_9STRA|mmetsp:Transcript_35125/g.73160  ORF Transcript_35125/g.73160 Transcript_35125/m.73160 type:complete len:506 (+) Transcript_35125:129-1646(+)